MKCNKCGAELLPNDTFCGNCGNKIQAGSNTNTGENLAAEDFTPHYRKMEYYDENATRSGYETDNAQSGRQKREKKPHSPVVAVVITTVLLLLAVFTVFNFLLMTERIQVSKTDALGEYKDALSGFLNLPTDEVTDGSGVSAESTSAPTESGTMTGAESTTALPTQPSTTQASSTSEAASSIPSELQQYADGLVYEGKTYRITLQGDDWYINYRSSPELIGINESPNNILGKMKHGYEIYVEYIYDKTWAVFYKDGQYVFSSLYASNDPSLSRLMEAK